MFDTLLEDYSPINKEEKKEEKTNDGAEQPAEGQEGEKVAQVFTKTCPCNIQRFFFSSKNRKFHWKNFDIFNIYAQNIDCGYMLEPRR